MEAAPLDRSGWEDVDEPEANRSVCGSIQFVSPWRQQSDGVIHCAAAQDVKFHQCVNLARFNAEKVCSLQLCDRSRIFSKCRVLAMSNTDRPPQVMPVR